MRTTRGTTHYFVSKRLADAVSALSGRQAGSPGTERFLVQCTALPRFVPGMRHDAASGEGLSTVKYLASHRAEVGRGQTDIVKQPHLSSAVADSKHEKLAVRFRLDLE